MTCKTEDACYGDCPECKAWEKGMTIEEMVEQGMALDIEFPDMDVVDEDWLSGVSCNPDEPEMCESCQ